MFFDTHCHLNFGTFNGRVEEIVDRARQAGVDQIVIPGTDVPTSEKAVAIAEKFEGVFAAVGIHPHHVFEVFKARKQNFLSQRGPFLESEKNSISSLSKLLTNPKVVAIGEVGIDRHIYQKTKYPDYKIEEEFIELQKIFLKEQIKLAIKHNKSLILHSREAKNDMLGLLESVWDRKLEGRTVFHCCEPDSELLEFAKEHKMFVGVDGDVIYYKEKQEFIKNVQMEMLVLETDSPFLSPDRKFSNEPKNIKIIAEFIASLLNCSIDSLKKQTTENAKRLFNCG
ncbi:MAG: TatD family hydrolase [Patescibacteria group bacterium]|jgi:TatD DNase family protein